MPLDIDWYKIKRMCIEHAEEVLREAEIWRKKGISPYRFSKTLKVRWEKELYRRFSKAIGKGLSLLGKDTGLLERKGAEITLVVDLFDGSLNFLFDCKYYSYNVALFYGLEPIFGLCIDLETFDVFSALKNQGAFLNEKKLEGPPPFTDRIVCSNVAIKGFQFLHFGCASLELCLLAKGAVDLVIGRANTPDIAASMLIASEAGATITDWHCKDIKTPLNNMETVEYIAGNPESIQRFLGSLRDPSDIMMPMPSIWSTIAGREIRKL